MFALPYRWVTQIAFISANNPYSGKGPQFRFFYVVKGGEEKKKKEGKMFLLGLQGLDCLQLKIILLSEWCILGVACPWPLPVKCILKESYEEYIYVAPWA